MPYGDKHIPEERLQEMLDDLRQHYGEPVRPVSEYCQAFYDWQKVWGEKIKRIDDGKEPDQWTEDPRHARKILEALNFIMLPIIKSNYLWRRLYGDGLHRTEMCPEHKGRWSGYSHDRACDYGCNHGYDLTGWLPEPHVFVEKPEDTPVLKDSSGKIIQYGRSHGPRDQCYQCGGTLEKGQHIDGDS
jgi:hypothetical protein